MTHTDMSAATPASMMAGGDPRRAVDEAIRAALDRLDPQTRLVSGYHLGYWDSDGRPSSPGGKRIRPALALLSARAAGAPAQRGVPAAVACELVHSFSLLHDDIMDGDTERRHRPTAWSQFSRPAAILAGDALFALANQVLADAAGPTAIEAVGCLNTATLRLIAGQAADLAFETRDDVTLDECVQMAEDKTGALLASASSLGAVLVGAPAVLARALADYGGHVGLAFQIVDDLLGIWGSPELTGKPVRSDLRSRKKSLPVVAALTASGPAADELRARYANRRPWTEDDLAEVAKLVEAAGGRAWAERAAREEAHGALRIVAELPVPDAVRDELAALTAQLSERDH